MKVCGIDEAGRGSVIGPMAVAGVLFQEDIIPRLKREGVRDSKQLTPKERERLYQLIVEWAEAWRIVLVEARRVDAATRRMSSEGINALEARVFAEIIDYLEPDIAYIDLPSRDSSGFSENLRSLLSRRCKLILEYKADERYTVVSAASILAKVARDREVEKLRKVLGDFGSGYPHDPKTLEFLRRMGEEGRRSEYVRWSWRTVDKALQRSLDEYWREEG